MAKKKPISQFKSKQLKAVLASKPIVVLSNWVFQGMRYMDWGEILVKIAFGVLVFLLFHYLLFDKFTVTSISISGVSAHTINWVINGHIYVLLRYVWPVKIKIERYSTYAQEIAKRAEKYTSVHGMAVYGSYCRNAIHEHSDLDVRVFCQPGFINRLVCSLFCFKERAIAFVKAFPLDIYLVSELSQLQRLSEKEIPVIFVDKEKRVVNYYSQ